MSSLATLQADSAELVVEPGSIVTLTGMPLKQAPKNLE